MTSLSILHIYKDYAPVIGGIENHIGVLTRGLRDCGIDARVLVTNTNRRSTAEVIDGVPVIKTGRLLNVSSAPISPWLYPALWQMEEDLDIAHLHLPYPPGELGQLALGRGRRVVLSYHSDIVRQRVLGAIYSPFLKLILRRADLIAVSNPAYIRTSAFLRTVMGKCRVIPYGIKLDRFRRVSRDDRAVAQVRQRYGQPLILFVGKLRHYKGVDVVIQAMRQIDAQLLVVGDGPKEAEWKRLAAECGVNDKVHFVGEFSDDELVNAYHAADVFTLPSTNRAEAFGIVQLEAMACGLPVVCTELGTGTSFVNQHETTGFVVQPNQPYALAQAINRLLDNDSLRHEMGRKAKERADVEFSDKTMVTRIIGFYQEALQIER